MYKAFPQVNWEDDILPGFVVDVVVLKELLLYSLQRLVLHQLEWLELCNIVGLDKAVLDFEQGQITLEQSQKHLQVFVGDLVVLDVEILEFDWILFRADESGAEQV